MRQRIIGNERAVDALASLCRDYRGTAQKSIRQGDGFVYMPVDVSSQENLTGFLSALADPKGILELRGSNESGEPCYASFREFLSGTNENGTVHAGYVKIDPLAKLAVELGNRQGPISAAVSNPFDQELMELYGKNRMYSYCLPNE